jgi:hypothetical protein
MEDIALFIWKINTISYVRNKINKIPRPKKNKKHTICIYFDKQISSSLSIT